jgi:phosphoglycolate phosphatase
MTAPQKLNGRKGERWPAAVVFDLDGTLVDSVGDITSAINDLLGGTALPPFSENSIRKFIGDGIDALVERVFEARGIVLSPLERRKTVESYELIYGARLAETTRAYRGVIDVISELRANGVGIGICTNKVEDKALGVVEGLGLREYFDVIVGGRRGQPSKPSPVPLLNTLQYLGVAAADAVMVGDSVADVRCARAAGTAIIGVSFGYSTIPMRELDPDFTIDDYSEFKLACASLR